MPDDIRPILHNSRQFVLLVHCIHRYSKHEEAQELTGIEAGARVAASIGRVVSPASVIACMKMPPCAQTCRCAAQAAHLCAFQEGYTRLRSSACAALGPRILSHKRLLQCTCCRSPLTGTGCVLLWPAFGLAGMRHAEDCLRSLVEEKEFRIQGSTHLHRNSRQHCCYCCC